MVRNCSNVLLKQSRVIKRNGGKWKSYDKSFISWIDKKDIYKRVIKKTFIKEYFPKPRPLEKDMNVE